MTILALIPDFINRHLGWYLFGVILIAGVALGLRDILQLSWKRIWAISGVCYSESIRRRVLLITPLAILGIIIVSQLQRPLDEADAVRQTIKIALFATGLLVAVSTVILACTNLPREIDNRVIFTVVTKPTTRLEIIIGKVIGFARVSFLVLLIMGAFTYGYLSFRAWNMQREIAARLKEKDLSASSIATLQYYRDAGLLNAKTLETPDALQVVAHVPQTGETRRYIYGHGEASFLVPFEVTPEMLTPSAGREPGEADILIVARVGYRKIAGAKDKIPATQVAATAPATTSPTTVPYYGPFIMSPEQRAAVMKGEQPSTELPTVTIDVSDANMNTIGAATPLPPLNVLELQEPEQINEVMAVIDQKVARQMKGRVYVRITASSAGVEYFIDPKVAAPVIMVVGDVVNGQRVFQAKIDMARDPANPSQPAEVVTLGRSAIVGQQIRGGSERAPIAMFQFRNAQITPQGDEAPFELRTAVERSGADETAPETELPTQVAVSVRNIGTGQTSAETMIQPESNRTLLFTLPAASLQGGNFDVLVRCTSTGDFLGLQNKALVAITNRQPFWWNLAKSMLILWLMSILITTIAICASTFLSWPIAVVFTLVVLLGHWGVEQLGDATAPGVGAQVVTDFGLKNAAKAEAVRATVEKLSSFLNFISTVLPDINKFPAVEDIERGVAIPPLKLTEAAGVALGFGLPMVLLAYLILKNKEVAP